MIALNVFVSASWKGDLEDERKMVEDLIKSDLLMNPIYPREASTRDVPSECFKELNECDLVIAILGSRYSKHVHNEINHAFNSKKSVLCFKKDCERDEELEKVINDLENRIVMKSFKTTEELKKVVKETIINLLFEKFRDYKEIEKSIIRLINDGRIELISPQPFQSEYIDVRRINPYELR